MTGIAISRVVGWASVDGRTRRFVRLSAGRRTVFPNREDVVRQTPDDPPGETVRKTGSWNGAI